MTTRRQKLTGKIPTDKPPDPENGQRHGYSDLGDHVVAFPSRPEAAPILGVAMYTFQPLGICPKCSIGADGYIRGQKGVWALCQHCRCRWGTDYSLPSWIPDQPEEPAPLQHNWTSERIWAFREKMIAEYRTAEQIAADDMIMVGS